MQAIDNYWAEICFDCGHPRGSHGNYGCGARCACNAFVPPAEDAEAVDPGDWGYYPTTEEAVKGP